jgi:hypothetical protein
LQLTGDIYLYNRNQNGKKEEKSHGRGFVTCNIPLYMCPKCSRCAGVKSEKSEKSEKGYEPRKYVHVIQDFPVPP